MNWEAVLDDSAKRIDLNKERAERQHDRAVRMTQVIQRFASTLTQRQIRTRLVETGSAPAWSTSNTITFVENDLADLTTPQGALSAKGLSLHEVCHILFTPRSGSDIVRWVMDNKLGKAFNALEDQRIETLMVGRFGDPIVPWLTATVAQHLVGKPSQLPHAFPLIRGRKYLPVELRRACFELYNDQANVQELASIIDEYRLLVFPEDFETAKPLIERYAQLVEDGNLDSNSCASKPADSWESNSEGRPANARQQRQARSNAEARDEKDELDEDNFDFGDPDWDDEDEAPEEENNGGSEDSGGDSDESDESGSGASDEDAEEGAEGDNSGEDADAPAKDGNGAPQDGNGGNQAGATGTATKQNKLEDLLNDIIDETLKKLEDEVNTDIAKFNGEVELTSNRARAPRPASCISQSVSEDIGRASRSFGIELERLRAQFDPSWEREVSSGRISTSRYLRGAPLKEAFDRWSIGREDAVDIEAVILLDVSGSMDGARINRASEAMWGLKRALDKVGASCTVVTFNTDARLLYEANETATATVKHPEVGGGTKPESALRYATRVLADSDRAMKVLFTITDGEWFDATESEKQIETLRRAGVFTALAYISEWGATEINAHKCEVSYNIQNASDLFMLGRKLVKVATARNLAK